MGEGTEWRLECWSLYTIKGGSRRAEKSRKALMMMMKAVKLGWAGAMKNSESKMVLVRLW